MRNIRELPGAQPPAQLDSIEIYGSEKGWADTYQPILEGREDFKREHGAAPYIGYCLKTMCPLFQRGRWLPARGETALTDFLTNEHDIPLPLDNGIWVFGQPRGATSLDFLIRYTFEPKFSLQKPHLDLVADGHYDFVNLEARKLEGVEGKANIAHVPGIEEVLIADCIALLLEGQNGPGPAGNTPE